MIKTLSTYFLEIPFTNPDTMFVPLEYRIKLYIWQGSKLAVPLDSTYTITNPNPTLSNGIDKIDISRLINDFFEFSLTFPVLFNTLQNGNNQAWVKWEILYGDTPLVISIEETNLAVKGYGFYQEGINPQLPANRILIDSNDFNISYDSIFVLPILLNEVTALGDITIKSFPSLSMDLTIATAPTSNSNELVKYLFVKPTIGANQEEYIEIKFNEQTIFLNLTAECKYEPIDVFFQNRNGAVETLTFFKARKDSLTVKKETYSSNIDYNYNVNSRSKFDVNSGWITEDKNTNIKQLLLSEKVFIIENGINLPLIVETKTLEYKTRVNDKLINYKIEFSYAFEDIS